jgi:FkbM family methyltransferase
MHYINFTYGELQIKFECLNNVHTVQHVTSILKGDTYKSVPCIPNVKTIVDVGANLGATSLLFSCWYPDATLYSIEPQREVYEILARNSERNPNAKCFNFGLYDSQRRTPLYKSRVEAGTASIGKSFLNTALSEEIELRDAATFFKDQQIDAIDILKVDTEGCEYPILMSIKEKLPRIWVIYLEYHSEEDRRRIDDLLAPTHVLLRAKVEKAHCGEVTYVRTDLGNYWPDLHLHRIVMPA